MDMDDIIRHKTDTIERLQEDRNYGINALVRSTRNGHWLAHQFDEFRKKVAAFAEGLPADDAVKLNAILEEFSADSVRLRRFHVDWLYSSRAGDKQIHGRKPY